MSVDTVRSVGTRQKRMYDLVVLSIVTLYLAIFVSLGLLINPYITIETLFRAFPTASFALLTIVLSIGLFFSCMGVIILLGVFVGFAPTSRCAAIN